MIRNLNERQLAELRKFCAKGKYELTEGGIFVKDMGLFIGGFFEHSINGEPAQLDPNLVVLEGRVHVLQVVFSGGSQKPTWYLAIHEGGAVPTDSWTAQNYDTNANEIAPPVLVNATRPEFVEVVDTGAGSVGNAASPAQFTVAAGQAVTVTGAALLSSSNRTYAPGDILFSASQFASTRPLVENDVFNVGYSLLAQDA